MCCVVAGPSPLDGRSSTIWCDLATIGASAAVALQVNHARADLTAAEARTLARELDRLAQLLEEKEAAFGDH